MSDLSEEQSAETLSNEGEPNLQPATFDENEERAFKAQGPWKWVFVISLVLATVIGFFQWRDRTRQGELRAEITQRYRDEIGPVGRRVNAFRQKIESWVMQAAERTPDARADPDFDLAALHDASGIYLRMHIDSVTDDPMSIRDSGITMEPDTIATCMGLSPVSMRGFYERAEFLQPIWIEDAEAADTVLRLRVFLDELAIRQERDLPLLEDMANAEYFLLTLQHGELRRDHPVDVYIWDLTTDQLMLQGRIQARGTLIPVRIAFGGAPRGRAQPLPQRSAVSDCSIASQIREIAGGSAVSVRSAMPEGPVVTRESEEAAAETAASGEALDGSDSDETESEGAESEEEESEEADSETEPASEPGDSTPAQAPETVEE